VQGPPSFAIGRRPTTGHIAGPWALHSVSKCSGHIESWGCSNKIIRDTVPEYSTAEFGSTINLRESGREGRRSGDSQRLCDVRQSARRGPSQKRKGTNERHGEVDEIVRGPALESGRRKHYSSVTEPERSLVERVARQARADSRTLLWKGTNSVPTQLWTVPAVPAQT
jgi:hypothetical protein